MKEKPLRMCVSCRTMKSKDLLIRVVKTPEGFVIDRRGKMNGRGAYVCRDEKCINLLVKNKGLNRAFKCEVPEKVISLLKEELSDGAEGMG